MIPLDPARYRQIARLADREAGLHMPESKQSFVASRLQKRLRHHGLGDFGAYLALLSSPGAEGAAERQAMVSALTTNVTDIYREPHHFELLAAHLDAWHARRTATGGATRYLVWSAGCSTGEEALSIAAICHAILGPVWARRVQVLATDVDHAVLAQARARAAEPGLARRLAVLPGRVGDGPHRYPVDPATWLPGLLAGITYLHHDLRHELGLPGLFDVIFCRNVTIYFSAEAQRATHDRLRARLAPGGLLAIGHSERLLGDHPPLVPAGRTAFRRPPAACPPDPRPARAASAAPRDVPCR